MTRNQIACAAIVSLLITGDAHAQQQTIYGPDGKVTGRSSPTVVARRRSTTRAGVSPDGPPRTVKARP